MTLDARPLATAAALAAALLVARPSAAAPPPADAPPPAGPSTAFFYGPSVPAEMLAQFDQVVVQPDDTTDADLATIARYGARPLAYLSVGEVARPAPGSPPLDRRWVIGDNPAWRSLVTDPAQPGYRAHLVEQAAALCARGFGGLFLDTLDSYEPVLRAPAERELRRRGLVELVRALHRRCPDARLVLNRGFALLPDVHDLVAAVAAESLFRGYQPSPSRYRAVPDDDRRWLLAQLERVRGEFHLPVIVIDYLPPAARVEARALAARIAALGYVPWVADGELATLGVGALEVLPRHVLALWDSDETECHCIAESAPNRLAAVALDYLGYVVDYLDVRREPLPRAPLAGRYAGVLGFFTDDEMPSPRAYREWLLRQIDSGVPVAILDHPGLPVDAALLARLGLAPVEPPRGAVHVVHQDRLVGLEAPPGDDAHDLVPLAPAPSSTVEAHLVVEDARGRRFVPVLTAPWGGLALAPFTRAPGYEGEGRWIVDPVEWLRAALRLPPMPAPDVTTESGSRLLFAQVDGDGFLNRAELPGTPYAAEVIRDRILAAYPIPTTVSVIEGEVGPAGLHPSLAPALEAIARAIFRLPNVELASHTYSHPFDWSAVDAAPRDGADPARLAIPGYRYDLRREIEGSVAYIDGRLAPPGKRVKVMLWSGTALPPVEAVAMATRLGLANMNHGDTKVTDETASLTEVAPLGLPLAPGAYQVFAPITNENLYTHEWHGPYFGFRRVIETLRLTDAPRRTKPIDIYYHFYSGSKPASLGALEEVYRYALAQEHLAVYASDYCRKVGDFLHATVARALDGSFQLEGFHDLRTVRLDGALGWPDVARSRGVASVREITQGRYVGVVDAPRVRLALAPAGERPEAVVIERANARVLRWEPDGAGTVSFRLAGAEPVLVRVRSPRACRVEGGAPLLRAVRDGAVDELRFGATDTGEARLVCR